MNDALYRTMLAAPPIFGAAMMSAWSAGNGDVIGALGGVFVTLAILGLAVGGDVQ